MKKKFLLVLAAVAVASLLWACGSGDVLNLTQSDDLTKMTYTGGGELETKALQGMVDSAIAAYCQGNEECIQSSQPGGYVAPQAQSSSSLGYVPINKDQVLSSFSTGAF